MYPNNMAFLEQRIYEIGSALLYNLGNSSMQYSATIINALKVDERGYLYAIIQKPDRVMHTDEMMFPVRLKFYRKGKPFHIEVQGSALLIDDASMLNNLMHWKGEDVEGNISNAMIVKMKMEEISYYEWKQSSGYKGIKGLFKKCYQWLLGINPFSFSLHLQPATS